MRAVFLDQQTFSKDLALTAIEEQLDELVCYQTTSPTELIARCKDAQIIITNKVVINADTLKQLPQLKLICIAATGTNNIDIKAAKARNIAVTNVSGYANKTVAQYVFAQILEYYSQTSHHHNNTRLGLWQKSETFCYHGNHINELAGKTLGIIGYGSLGQAVAKLAEAFDMKILITERFNASKVRSGRVAFEQVIKQADIISLHCPQTPETEQLVNSNFLSRMKPSAMLINSARGALIDNKALLNALKNKDIAYAVLDVLEQEPPPNDHLLLSCDLDNLKITAHIAWASQEAQQRLLYFISKNIESFSKGQQLNRVG